MRIKCPHCGSAAVIRSSRPMSLITQEGYCQCTNVECATTFVIMTTMIRTIAPSQMPNPRVYIPYSKHRQSPKNDQQGELAMS